MSYLKIVIFVLLYTVHKNERKFFFKNVLRSFLFFDYFIAILNMKYNQINLNDGLGYNIM